MITQINLEQHADLFGGVFDIQISNEPRTGLIRVIDYFGANISQRYKQVSHDADMHYFTPDGIYLPDFKQKVQQRGRNWKVDNSYEVIQRNSEGIPVLDEEGNPIKHPAFDYFINVVYSIPVPLGEIIKASIQLDDALKLFDK